MAIVKITDHQREVLEQLESKKDKILNELGMLAEGFAKDKCPVDTGNLRNSISYKVVDDDVYIGTNVEYAVYVEMGTGSHYAGGSAIKGMEARPYLKPAVTEHRSVYEQVILDEMKK